MRQNERARKTRACLKPYSNWESTLYYTLEPRACLQNIQFQGVKSRGVRRIGHTVNVTEIQTTQKLEVLTHAQGTTGVNVADCFGTISITAAPSSQIAPVIDS
jgi:hypothetical protein